MLFEIAKSHLEKFGLEDRIQESEIFSVTVELAAQAVGCEPARITRTLSFLVDGRAMLIAVAGDAKVDNPCYKNKFHTEAKMPTPDEVTELVGHSVGSVCPFGAKEDVRVFLDESLKRFETVYLACGSVSSAVGLTIAELEQCPEFEGWIDMCKAWREEEQQQVNIRKKVPALGKILLYDRW